MSRYEGRKFSVDEAKVFQREDPSAMRKEYTRMRDIAQKRIKRMGEAYEWTKTYKSHSEGFQKLKDIAPEDFAKAFSELSKFVNAKISTVAGQRSAQRKTTETLNKAVGQEGAVNSKNYKRVVTILDEARKKKITYDSDKIVQLADATLPLTNTQFDDVLDNLDAMLLHSSEVAESLSSYISINNLSGYTVVNIDDFREQTGW